jgi:hypothetical protein
LIVLAPLAMAIVCASWLLASVALDASVAPLQSTLAIGAGALAVSCVSAGIATLVPRHAMALTIVYVLADLLIGALPASLAKLSITHHATVLGGRYSDGHAILESGLALAAISAVWLIVGLRRIRRLEA